MPEPAPGHELERVAGEAYAVKLPVFEGPLDLLLYLIEREELDITKVSLAQVTNQYLAYLNTLEYLNLEHLADFMVVAAKLILIKSQALLPRPPAGPEEEDVGDDLVRQLIAYKQFKEVARGLGVRQDAGLRSFVRLAPRPKLEASSVDLGSLSLDDLLAAVRHALSVARPALPVGVLVQPFTITVRDRIALIGRMVQLWPQVSFTRLLSQSVSRMEIIVTFLAVLELLKRHSIRVSQAKMFGEIMIEAAPPGEMIAPSDEGEDSFADSPPDSGGEDSFAEPGRDGVEDDSEDPPDVLPEADGGE